MRSVALAVLLVATPVVAHAAPIAAPQQAADSVASAGRALRIDAGPLADALAEFVRQTGVRVSADPKRLAGRRAAAIDGRFSPAAALDALLAGTGLVARFPAADVAVVQLPDETTRLATVRVTARAARAAGYAVARTSSATKTSTPLRDAPQSVSVVTRELIADQSMQSMADVVRYVPGVSMALGEGHRDAPTIRGNASTADLFVDGVRDDAQYLRDVYNVDRVEALKGANAMTFGRGGGGGVINRVTREADWTRARTATVEGGSFDHRRATLDVGQGFGDRAAGRADAVYERSGGFRDGARLTRYGINPTVAVAPDARTTVRAGYELFDDRRTVDRGVPSSGTRPADVPIETFFGNPDANHSRVRVNAATASVERTAGHGVVLRNRTRLADYGKFYQNTYPGAVNAAAGTVAISAYNHRLDRRNLFNQTEATAALGTGALRHVLLAGAELGRQRTDQLRNTGYFGTATTLAAPLDAPTVNAPVDFHQSATDADNRAVATAASGYAQDQLSLGTHWQAIAGLRYERFTVRYQNNRDGTRLERSDAMLSPRAGLLFKPAEPVSFYASVGRSYLPSSGDQFTTLTVITAALAPERFTNREVGAKWDPTAALSLTAAAYRLDRTNTSAPDPLDATRTVQTGAQRTTGVELGATGRLTSRWQIAGGLASQRATIVSATAAARAGATVPLVPHASLSLWNRVQLAPSLGIGLGLVGQSRTYAAIDNTVVLPGFARADGAAFVGLGRSVRAQLNVENLLGRRYWASAQGNNNILPGAPRTLRLSLTTSL